MRLLRKIENNYCGNACGTSQSIPALSEIVYVNTWFQKGNRRFPSTLQFSPKLCRVQREAVIAREKNFKNARDEQEVKMNIYKLVMLLKEFLLLDEILRKRDQGVFKIYKGDSARDFWIQRAHDDLGKKLGFRMEESEDYFTASYIEIPDSVLIKRADQNLLSITPSFDSYSWSDGGHHNHESYCAVSKAGDGFQYHWLKEAGSSRTGSGDHNEESAAPIGEQLYHLGVNPDYIVCYDFQDTDDNGNGEEILSVTIYKMKSFNLAEYHCAQIDRAARELKSEIRAACVGGE